MAEQRDFKGVWIPKDIWLNEELTLLEKIIYTEIDSLDNESNCTAGNEHFAKFCNCSESKVTKAIKKLQELNMIEIVSFDGRHRRIRVVKSTRQSSKKYEADSQKVRPSNTSNNTNNNNISISKDIDNSDFKFGTNKTSTKNSSLNTEWFISNYHSMCVSLPKIRAITDKRKKAIAKIMKSYSKEEILEVFTLAESSDFLKGNNDRGWKADIDFILREDKFARILEGGYSSKKQSKKRFQNEGISIPYTKEDRIRDEEFRKEMRANGESTIF